MTRRPAYDMFYLALAKREDAAFLTADTSMRKEAARLSIRIDRIFRKATHSVRPC